MAIEEGQDVLLKPPGDAADMVAIVKFEAVGDAVVFKTLVQGLRIGLQAIPVTDIESNSHIVVFNEIINSTLLARKTITMKFGKFSVLGGHLLAGESMDLFNVGSETGAKTILEVGKDFEVEAEMAEKNRRLLEHGHDLEFLRDMDDQLANVVRLRRGASDEDILLQKRTQGAMQVLEGWIAKLRRDLGELSRRLYSREPCTILIRGTAHPGTVLKYRDDVVVIPQAVSNRRWTFREKGDLPSADGQSI